MPGDGHVLASLGVTWDDDGNTDGWQIGKAAALLDWQHRKEAAEFEKLCTRIYKRRWAARLRATEPERVREALRQWREANRDRLREAERRRMRAKRAAARCELRCDECGRCWTPERKSRFCSKRCRNRWHGARRKRNRGLRQMDLCATIRSALRETPWLSAGGIVQRSPRLKPGSVATKLTVLHQTGELVRKKAGRGYVYALPGDAR